MENINIFMDISNPIFQLLIAAFLGVFVGLRREVDLQKKNIHGIRGVRTSSLVTIMGVVSTFLSQFPYLPIIFLISLIIGVILVYRKGLNKGLIGMTSEISLILLFLTGVFIGYEKFTLGIVLGLLVAISDAYKDILHSFAKNLKIKEWSGTLQMILITLVVLPFLPKVAIDPWGVFIPYNVWLLVVLVTGISFIGYFLNKFFSKGKIKGVYLTSFLGSIISSTAVTVGLSQKLKNNKEKTPKYFLPSILLAIFVMEFRDLIIIILATNKVNLILIATPLIMGIVSIVMFYWFFKKDNEKNKVDLVVDEKSPFEILPSLKFALIFSIILFLVYFVKKYVGDNGVYFTTFLVSLIDTETIILPSIESFKNGTLDIKLLGNIITISIVINTLIKLFYIQFFSGNKSLKVVIIPIITISVFGLLPLIIF